MPINDLPNTNEPVRELSYGEKAVGLTFNPSNDTGVQSIKEKFAAIIDELNAIRPPYDGKPNEKSRMIAIAITEAQSAQMWAVKAITWRY